MAIFSFLKNIDIKQALSWALFDFANSSYSVIIISLVFPIYFIEIIAPGGYGDFYWGLMVSLSTIASAFVLPIIGGISDYDMQRKSRFVIFAALAIIGTALLYFSGPGALLFAAVVFVLTKFFYELAIVSYDSFLVTISTRETSGEISGLGWGLGYLGGTAALLLFMPLYASGFAGALDANYRLTFPLTALFFLLFSIPAFLFIKEKPVIKKKEAPCDLIMIGIKRAKNAFGEIMGNKPVALFLVAFYFLHDALTTLYVFIPIYLRDVFSLGFSDILMLFIIIQLIGFPSAILLGWLSDKLGTKRILLGTIVVWLVVVVMLYYASSITMLYILAVLAGLVIGSSQAIARSWLSKIVPRDERSEFFGFNALSSKVAASAGPLLFGIISVTIDQRTAMLCLLPFFVISFILFSRIKE